MPVEKACSLRPRQEDAGSICSILRLLPALALYLAATAGAADEGDATSFDGIDRALVREFLLAHPEVVLDDKEVRDAIRRVRLEREQKRTAAERRSVLETRADLLQSTLTPSTGDASSAMNVIEFYDYQCGPCKASYPELEQVRTERPHVRYIYGQLPIYGSFSVVAARAAIAAQRQGLFKGFHHALMTASTPLDMGSIVVAATEVGLDVEKLRADMRDPEIHAYLEEVRLLAEALGVMGTPSFIVGDAMLSGGVVVNDLMEVLDRQRVQNEPGVVN